MTPMQSLKNQFDIFKHVVPAEFKELALNKSRPKVEFIQSYFCDEPATFENRGVSSDFIKTFKAKFNDEDSYSIGFSFRYLELPKKDHTVRVTLKKGNKNPSFLMSKDYSVEEFRNEFVATICKIEDLEDKNYKKIVDIITKDFALRAENHQELKARKKKEAEKRKNRM